MLVQDDRDLLAPALGHEQDVLVHARPQALERIGDGEDLGEHLLLEDVHPVVLDLEEQMLLAPDVVVEAGLGEAGRRRRCPGSTAPS